MRNTYMHVSAYHFLYNTILCYIILSKWKAFPSVMFNNISSKTHWNVHKYIIIITYFTYSTRIISSNIPHSLGLLGTWTLYTSWYSQHILQTDLFPSSGDKCE